MKDKLVKLLAALLALGRTPTSEEDSIESQKNDIQLHREEIDTMHGDEDFNSEEVSDIIDDLIEVLSTSEPDADYAEVPEDAVEGEKKSKKGKSKAEPEEPADEEEKEEEESSEDNEEESSDEEEEEEETPKQRKARLAEEAEAAKAKAKKGKSKK